MSRPDGPGGGWDGDLARDQGAVWCMWLAQWGAVRCSRGVRCSAGGGTCRQGLNVHGAGLRAVLRGCAGGGDGASGAGRSTPEAFQGKGGCVCVLEFAVTHQLIHLGPSPLCGRPPLVGGCNGGWWFGGVWGRCGGGAVWVWCVWWVGGEGGDGVFGRVGG